MTNSNDFCTRTTGNLYLLIIARLIAKYKHSIEALAAALEKFFLAKHPATSRTPYLVEILPVPSLIL